MVSYTTTKTMNSVSSGSQQNHPRNKPLKDFYFQILEGSSNRVHWWLHARNRKGGMYNSAQTSKWVLN